MGTIGINFKNIQHQYRTKDVLRGVSFHADPSSITFLAGENGAGKTTLIKVALGLISPKAGNTLFDGLSVGKIREKIGCVFDEPPVYPHESGFDNLKFLSGIHSLDPKWSQEVCAMLNLDKGLLKHKAKALSLGQRHRLAVAAALLRKPKYLFLDEPSIGLDPPSWQLVQTALKQMADRGCAILITGQNYDAMENLADNIAILQNGKLIFSGSIVKLVQAFPVHVRIVTDDHREIAVQFPEAEHNSSGIYRIVCESSEEARAVIDQVRRSTLNFQELSIEKASMGKMMTDIYAGRFRPERRGLAYESVQN
ncbi:ABC transporter ATP-binding protein [Bacillus haynesii]|uniref:ABC transporter ATP-binding protein n=1 Tax=Bacillus haynesii TaxID=1925021 RepID=UPI001F27A814|nr:ABC transporter ATP-binding protein [Bacillus haynesii]UIN46611.1 ABC transporter ATP-binding protein [Bacillus licheniformis]MCY8378582.1 ABC transporter ATP-binding protein [Bacillus haynesii]MCY8651478.1 ABC transporter ATP-binding protein [Bacillus haynesii]MCY9411868.1 ABC transporter ATP-binding protein [Bacillus haynesii]MEC0676013.1 ABC transporter ATP-binding protein [Bacillus haynesii]